MLTDNSIINVLNYEGFASIPSVTNHMGIGFPASIDGEPTITPVHFIDIKSANARTDMFKTGRLKFEKEIEDKIYESLLIDKNEILTIEDIEDIILKPTKEKIEKIIKCKSLGQITRVKDILFRLKRSYEHDISQRISDFITTRYQEISMGILNSNLKVVPTRQEQEIELKEQAMQNAMTEILTEEKLKIQDQLQKELEVEKEKIKKQLEKEYKEKLEDELKKQVSKASKSTKTSK